MSEPRARLTVTLSLVMVAIGMALIVRTLAAGGGGLAVGLVLGVLFVAGGVGRVWMARGTGGGGR